MPILNEVSRKSFKGRGLIISFYLLLSIGAISMVFPFLLMFSGAMKGQYNSGRLNVIPRYLHDDVELYRAWCESKYTKVDDFNASNPLAIMDFTDLQAVDLVSEKMILKYYQEFRENEKAHPLNSKLGHVNASNQNLPEFGLAFIQHLDNKFGGLENTNEALNLNMPNWQSMASALIQQNFFNKSFTQNDSLLMQELLSYKQSTKEENLYYPSIDGQFRSRMILPFTGNNIKKINQMTGLSLKKISELHLFHDQGNAWYVKQRNSFVRQFLNPRYINMKTGQDQNFREFIKSNFHNNLEAAKKIYPKLKSFDELSLSQEMPEDVQEAALYGAYIERAVDYELIILRGPQIEFQNYLLKKFGDIKTINHQLGKNFYSTHDISIPQSALDYDYVMKNTTRLRWQLASINVRFVFNYLTQQGRAAWVTLVFCLLSIISALIVNPLAAYALSRYDLPSTYKVLMFFMCTMAFPIAVTQIPSFLLLKELGMLNTFWALVLPTMANGYSIFILKGFFDSLPKELYEAAAIDGAGEFRMFWQITLNLSKPVLALIALNSFTAAYGNFMYALLICQDESMWTIMVYLFKLQTEASQAVIFASLVVAAVPTLVIFLACQKVIMKGIVIPSEK